MLTVPWLSAVRLVHGRYPWSNRRPGRRGLEASAARKDQLKLTTLTFNADAYSDRLRGFWKPGGGKANPANAAAIHAWMKDKAKNDTLMKEWMKKNDITDTDSLGAIPAFVTSGDPALRAEAVKDLIDK